MASIEDDKYGYFDLVPHEEFLTMVEVGQPDYSPRVRLGEFAMRSAPLVNIGAEAELLPSTAPSQLIRWTPTQPDVITLAGFALGLWWCAGGPAWAALLSILADELDGRYARMTGQTSDRGAVLDYTADMMLTPLALARLGINLGVGAGFGLVAAIPVLFIQSTLKAEGYRPEVGSARAVVMLAGVAVGVR